MKRVPQTIPFSLPSSKRRRVRIGDSPCAVVRDGDLSVVFWGTVPLHHFRANDLIGRYTAAVDLVRLYGLRILDVAEALELGHRTVYRLLDRFDESGVDGLLGLKGRRMPTKIVGATARRLLGLKRSGISDAEAARRLGLSVSGVKASLQRLGWKDPKKDEAPSSDEAEQPRPAEQVSESSESGLCLPDAPNPELESLCQGQAMSRVSGDPDPTTTVSGAPVCSTSGVTISTDINPLNRLGDRMMAKLGLLDDAPPLFAAGIVPRGGVLLAVPLLITTGIFDIAPKVYGSIGPAFYGLRTSIMAFLLMALLRIKRAENLKEVAPPELGRVLGLDRAPEMKTLRGKLQELAAQKKGLELIRALAQERAKEHADDLGYLYVDGHVRVYNGDARIPKAYVMQRRLAMPGTSDYWVNDQRGQPLLMITASANEGMTKMLAPVLKEVRGVIGDRRATVVFDRGGWSPKLFKSLIADGWDILTYRKGKTRKVSVRAFEKHEATIDGRKVEYKLAEKRVRFLGGTLKLRQITMLGDDGYQTNILASKGGVSRVELAYFMFARWRQENYFKYMKEEFALDALVEYGVEDADPNRMVPNPERKVIDKELNAARAIVTKLEGEYGAAAFDNKEDERRTMRGFKIANGGAIGKPLRQAREKVQAIEERRKSIPTRVPVSEALKDKPVQLRTETKRLSDTFKMVAYQTETALVDMLRPHYPRTEDEGRTFIASALQSAAELKLNDGELCVTLAAQSSPHRTRAIQAVCVELTKLGASYPGTNLRLRYEVAGTESLATTRKG